MSKKVIVMNMRAELDELVKEFSRYNGREELDPTATEVMVDIKTEFRQMARSYNYLLQRMYPRLKSFEKFPLRIERYIEMGDTYNV